MNLPGTLAGRIPWTALTYLSLCLLLGGLTGSHAMTSIGIFGLTAIAVLQPGLPDRWRYFRSQPLLWCLPGLFAIYVLSGLNSSQTGPWLQRLRNFLPFLCLPFAFTLFRHAYGRHLQLTLYFFALVLTVLCAQYTLVYLFHFQAINSAYSYGQVLPVHYNHVRFSLLVSQGVVLFYYLLVRKVFLIHPAEKYLQLMAGLFLIFFLHLFAVRSGLLAFYLSAFYLALRRLWQFRRPQIILPGLFLLCSLPVLAWLLLPTFHQKVSFVQYDLQSFYHDTHQPGLSDGGRILSVRNGLKLGWAHPWTGVGLGDLQTEMNRYYDDHPEIPAPVRMPHNQFVWVFAATGLPGALAFVLLLLIPLFYRENYRSLLITSFYLILLSSCLTEATLEDQVGASFAAGFLLLFYFLRKTELVGPAVHLSGVIISFNEEEKIGACIDSLRPVCEEIVVVDSFSTDRTRDIAEQKGAVVITHPFEGHIQQKNYALSCAKQDYVLSLDADEVLSPELQNSIAEVKDNFTCSGYRMNRLNNYAGQWIRHGGWYPDTKLRLVKKSEAHWGGENPHDRLLLRKGSSTGKLRGNLLHFTVQSSEEHAQQLEKFARIAGERLRQQVYQGKGRIPVLE